MCTQTPEEGLVISCVLPFTRERIGSLPGLLLVVVKEVKERPLHGGSVDVASGGDDGSNRSDDDGDDKGGGSGGSNDGSGGGERRRRR